MGQGGQPPGQLLRGPLVQVMHGGRGPARRGIHEGFRDDGRHAETADIGLQQLRQNTDTGGDHKGGDDGHDRSRTEAEQS